ncbi:MAG: sulfur carrier protein ThiS [Syntrophobacterales bacterium]|jgi:thiamine biosynthesis protein ThiS
MGLKITINGEPREVASGTVLDLLEELRLQPKRMVVEQNGVIIQRETYGEAPLGEGDVLELVRIVGGG